MSFTVAGAMPRKKYTESSFGERLQNLRKARGLTQVQLAESATTQPEASFPPSRAFFSLAQAIHVSTDELLGLKPPKVAPAEDHPEARRQWKSFQRIATLTERDQKADVQLIHSLVAGSSLRKNTSTQTGAQTGNRHGR
jgi:transcriptional regulator with XRE-family HTH domain